VPTLPLRVLELLASAGLAVLLPLAHARVAREQACLLERLPAWPVGPPPTTVANMSNWPTVVVTSRGCAMIMRSVSRGK